MDRPPAPRAHGDLGLGALLFVASGACGLLYEVVWSRRLELTFGSTVPAVATVLATYMAGLGVGAWAAGPLADRRSPARCVALYGLLELVVGLYGAASLLVCDAVDAAHAALVTTPDSTWALVVRGGLSFAALLPPTLVMGATLPLLSRALVGEASAATQRVVAGLYAANTLGAVVGAAAAGFVLLARFGLAGTVLVAIAGNLAIAGLTFAARRRLTADPAASRSPQQVVGDAGAAGGPRLANLGLALAFVFGVASLALEVAWTRELGLVFGSSSAGFTLALVGVLLGVALGSALVRSPAAPRTCAVRLVAAALMAGVGAALSLLLWPVATLVALKLTLARPDHTLFLAAQLLVGGALVLPATTAFGTAFPLTVQLGAAHGRVGRRVGAVYLVNTAGAVLGAGPASILALERLGVAHTVAAGALLLMVVAVALAIHLWRCRAVPTRFVLLTAAAVVLGAHLVTRGLARPPELWDLGPVVRAYEADADDPTSLERIWRQSGSALRWLADGSGATVSVRDLRHVRYLTINGKVDASSHGDMPAQLMCGLVPLVARPDAERVVVIGAGSGVTAAAARGPRLRQLEVVEIEPSVVEAARRHFAPWNLGVLDAPEVRVTIADGRTRLATARERFDVIVSQPTNPWVAAWGFPCIGVSCFPDIRPGACPHVIQAIAL